MTDYVGRVIDQRYRVLALLGEGAMGKVYKATRVDEKGVVAIKVLQESYGQSDEMRERFDREAQALFGLSHPHILSVQDFGLIDAQHPYLVMELLEGKTLDILVDDDDLDFSTSFELAHQLLDGLAYAHAQGAVHRDLKAENIFVSRGHSGKPFLKLLDFGLVKFTDQDRWGEGKKLTIAGAVMGSPAYMSPEQGTGGELDARSDVYSAGVVLYELFTGAWPYVAESRMDMLREHLLSPIPTLADGKPGLQARPELDALIRSALAKEPSGRFDDGGAMLEALEEISQPALWLQPPPPSSWPQPLPIGTPFSAPVVVRAATEPVAVRTQPTSRPPAAPDPLDSFEPPAPLSPLVIAVGVSTALVFVAALVVLILLVLR